MSHRVLLIAAFTLLVACGQASPPGPPDITAQIGGYEHLSGYFDLYWDEKTGRMIVRVDSFDEPFLYQASMARGVGSNDLGLDRGQLGSTKVVRFQRSGPKILLIEDNLDYRAQSDNPDEQAAVDESFAKSVIWGFESLGERDGSVYIDATDFMIRDAHRIAARLAAQNEGTYKPDASRSAIYMPMTKAFPDNSEVEAIVTFTGQPTGPWLRTVTPDAESFSVHLHHSFIRLPDDDYEPFAFESRSGFGGRDFQDYATPVGDALVVSFGRRHRLSKKDPAAEISEAVEPIVYYVDRG
ncbi:MAG: DUF5117 domain-containing protein, partial [Gammaproteobacteria bacterium]|nr:DUF5117 domain-containing protein [Gammaproteobacteria bacterium]